MSGGTLSITVNAQYIQSVIGNLWSLGDAIPLGCSLDFRRMQLVHDTEPVQLKWLDNLLVARLTHDASKLLAAPVATDFRLIHERMAHAAPSALKKTLGLTDPNYFQCDTCDELKRV